MSLFENIMSAIFGHGGAAAPAAKPAATAAAAPPSKPQPGSSTSNVDVEAGLTSTTLADLLTPLCVANPPSAVRATLRRQSSDEFDDGVTHRW